MHQFSGFKYTCGYSAVSYEEVQDGLKIHQLDELFFVLAKSGHTQSVDFIW